MKMWTWEMLAEEMRRGNIFEALDDVSPDLQPLMALALSVAKWSPDFRTHLLHGDLEILYAQNCALCLYWSNELEKNRHTRFFPCDMCDVCPLGKSGHGCNDSHSIWREALLVHEPAEHLEFNKHADKLYNVLVTLYAEEYYKTWPENKGGGRR
jgi:hypothetical protein